MKLEGQLNSPTLRELIIELESWAEEYGDDILVSADFMKAVEIHVWDNEDGEEMLNIC